jgi:hypothetical protein
VFDDVQSYLKTKEVEVNLLHIIANRRHLRCSIFIVAQNCNKVPKNIRQSFTDLFLFNVGKEEYINIFEENINFSKDDFTIVLKEYRNIKKMNLILLFIFMIKIKFLLIGMNLLMMEILQMIIL